MKIGKMYTTHMPMLIKAVLLTDGPVLELGAGMFSTPVLHWLCAGRGRRLVTYEAYAEYHRFAYKFRSRNHSVRLVDKWDDADLRGHWSVALIDHDADRRWVDALRLKDSVDYIILHDSEAPEVYGYDKVYSHFEHVFHWRNCVPWTTVVSNLVDLMELANDPI
jgi:hypothetical protein